MKETFDPIQPSALLSPYVKQYWFMSAEGIGLGSQRILPTGRMGLTFNRGGKTYSDGEPQPRASLFGQVTRHIDTSFENPLNLIVVIFKPIGVKAFFKIPLNEIGGKSIDIDLLYDNKLQELGKKLAETIDNKTCANLLDQYLIRRIYKTDYNNNYNYKRLDAVLQKIDCGASDISQLAVTACLGYRQFKRVFTDYTGLNPIEYIQIMRFSKTMHLLQTHVTNLEELALSNGYYDKSHLMRDFKSFSGYTTRQILENSDPYSENKYLFQSFFINAR